MRRDEDVGHGRPSIPTGPGQEPDGWGVAADPGVALGGGVGDGRAVVEGLGVDDAFVVGATALAEVAGLSVLPLALALGLADALALGEPSEADGLATTRWVKKPPAPPSIP
jgi:hypothetical protein